MVAGPGSRPRPARPAHPRLAAASWLLLLSSACAKGPAELAQDLRNPDPFVRLTAVIALGTCEPDRVRPLAPHLFTKACADPDPAVREECVATFRKLAARDATLLIDAVDPGRLEDPEVSVALDSILGGGGQALLPILIDELRSGDDARQRRLSVLVRVLRGAAVPPLVEMLADPRPQRRRMAISLLGELGPEAIDAVPALCAALDERSEVERRLAAESLACIAPGDERVQGALRPLAFDPDPGVRASALAPAIHSMLRDLASADPTLRRRAAEDLAQLGGAGVRALVERLEDPSPEPARAALAALRDLARRGLLADEDAPPQADGLSDPDPTLRACALLGSGAPRRPSIEELTAAIEDPSLRVRICAALALSLAGPDAREAAAPLSRMQLEENALARQVAHIALGAIEAR